MEAVPLIPKAKVLPNLDATPLIRELFQDELQVAVPTKKLSKNILKSLEIREEHKDEDSNRETFRSAECFLANRKENVIRFTENVIEAYKDHEKKLQEIKNAEELILETHSHFLNREQTLLEDKAIRDLLTLKRQPLFKALNVNCVRKYKLLEGEAGLPPEYQLKTDFRVQDFKKWQKRLESISQDSLIMGYLNRALPNMVECRKRPKKDLLYEKTAFKKPQKVKKIDEKPVEVFRAQPKVVFFAEYKLGDVYTAEIEVKNIGQKAVKFQLKPVCPEGPFRVTLGEGCRTTISPGLSFYLNAEFTPKSLDSAAEDIIIMTEDGNRFLIPLIAYLEPPVLKTHKYIDEYARGTADTILNSYIECGLCFTGDIKVTKLNFRCYRGSGEFFIMSSENWSRSYINTVTVDNILEIPPFRVYPVYFKIEKEEVIDLFVEFVPKCSGTHIENIVIACNNGQIRSLDLIGDAVGWHSYYFSFQDSLTKELPVDADDDAKVKYCLNFEDAAANGKMEKVFCICNNSNMPFDFQWKIREANILLSQEKYMKLAKDQVKIDPESGTFDPNSVWEFLVTITLNKADIGKYRMVLSLYVLNLPYQCIEEDNTIIQPTGFVRNLYSQSLYGEEEASALSPELASLQGTYESLQESIKSYVECQNKAQVGPRNDFCRTTCIPNPGLCAKPLKKSKTFFNIGDNLEDADGLGCVCKHRPVEPIVDSTSDSCQSNLRDERPNEMSPPRNEVIWDFVDILVDEIELWVEVFPTRVTLEPSIIHLHKPINVDEEPVLKDVTIINHNRSPVKCRWLMPSEISKMKTSHNNPTSPTSFSLLFDKNLGGANPDANEEPENSNRHQRKELEEDAETEVSKLELGHTQSSPCKFTVKPQKEFQVAGLSEFMCSIGIFPSRTGKIKQTLTLSVNEGDLELEVMILGTVVQEKIETAPDILDFGALKQGTRYTKKFAIEDKISPLVWNVNQFEFNLKNEKFITCSDAKEVALVKEDSSTGSYCLDARVPGIKCSLLEIENSQNFRSSKQYVLVLGDVKIPYLYLSAPRFENAILAPPGKIYVGQKVSMNVTLNNVGKVETFFTWGHSFGCHCRKIKVEICPKSCRIEKNQKLTVNIDLTALDEGIINHCYIPCFFCRSKEPLILSIVAIAENVNVTFEVIDYPMQTHTDPSTFLKSPFYHTVLRVSWPVKSYNPGLGLDHINEKSIRTMVCRCREVEEEASRAFGAVKDSLVDVEVSEKSGQRMRNFDLNSESSMKSKSIKSKPSKSSYDDLQISNSNQSGLNTLESKKSEESSILSYSSVGFSSESLQFIKPQLEFLNVPYRTPVLRQFVIRNETAIETTFQINVLTNGVPENLPDKRIEIIKNRVFGHSKDDFESKLRKDRPLVVLVEPSGGELKAFDAVCINVYCYGNTWGEYSDQLVCQIKGMEPYNLKIFVQIVGHPIYFPIFKTQTLLKPVLRFEPLSHIESAVEKQIKVVNRSAIPITAAWLVFLMKPHTKEEDREESFNLSADSKDSANLDIQHSGERSTQSSKNYIPKNASESLSTLSNWIEQKDFGPNSDGFKSLAKSVSSLSSLSSKKEKFGSGESHKITLEVLESFHSEMRSIAFPGRPDGSIFKVEPREMSFKPFEEKKLSVIFDPKIHKSETFPEEFQGVLTCCVKLKPEDEKRYGVYYRPCGFNFVSEVMDFNAFIEIPLVSFEILKGDLKFVVDANEIVKSGSKTFTILRKYLIKNKNQKVVSLTIEVSPGLIFKVTRVNTLEKFYPKYNPDMHSLRIEPGHVVEMELQCAVTYKDVHYAFEDLKRVRKQEQCAVSEEHMKSVSKSSTENDEDPLIKKEPWRQCADEFVKLKCGDKCSLGLKDSLQLNVQHKSSKSDYSICKEILDRNYGEIEGEYLELPKMEEDLPCLPKPPRHVTVIQEEINFVQSGLVTQNLMAELHISFPAIKISPKTLDFGNVFLGETAVRYCSLINLTGFPTDFRVMAKINSPEFAANPLTGSLPFADYNTDIGKTITIEFKPSQPGYFKELYHVYCNLTLEFDFYELFVSGLGTWNEKYRAPKFETYTKLLGVYPALQK